ncbi:hypothetical protein CMQ_5625 [Grosmannia clavigera kw1407]|uniref:Aminoglycoside phosphotransferase domain-containing protein n=1 Tax=Grosmannia clavigera (strain kw1407 / UAMH 11150) TaxID=655863 RepID=F0XSN1_GROCL|nr:uncharacterized protein CMQ_5625 [Grosmannia clavigera kw1407]EFW99204.1 hypothetical protein CMQ_5625 [Grosmannia clavigera kw1407]
MGGMHIHREILFDDGSVWLARILRENHTSFDDRLSNQILLSECATLQWLQSVDGVPSPRVHGFGLRGDRQNNEVGDVAYMLIEKLPGRPFDTHIATKGQRNKVLSQWSAVQRIWSFLADKMTRTEDGSSWLSDRGYNGLHTGPFFLKHCDDKGDHLLVDDDYRITGVIDWTFARAVPAYEAFGPSLISADMDSLYSGRLGLSGADRLLGKEMANSNIKFSCFFKSDKMRRFIFGLGMGLGISREEVHNLAKCLLKTFGHDEMPDWSTLPAPTARFATCSVGDCNRPGVRGRSCPTCCQHLCAVHILPLRHTCPSSRDMDDATWEANLQAEIDSLLAQVNVAALEQRASHLRGGMTCTFIPGSRHSGAGDENALLMGCANYHARLRFADGVEWLARIPRTTGFGDVPLPLVDYLIRSEFATLHFLETIGHVPAPRAYDYGLFGDPANTIGVGYILEDAIPGQPFYASEATAEQKAHVYAQYAEILALLSKHPQPQACSLVPNDDGKRGVECGPIASDRFLTLGEYGPFDNSLAYFSSTADLRLDLIADGQLFPKYPKEAFVFYRLLRDRIGPVLASETSPLPLGSFFLKHVDDKGDHVLVDDNYNITAVIDWQFARFVPACEAFGPSLFTADLGCLYGGEAGLSADDGLFAASFAKAGHPKLAKIAGENDLARRFHLGLASGMSRQDVLRLTEAVLSLLGESVNDVEEWIEQEWHVLADTRRDKAEALTRDQNTE